MTDTIFSARVGEKIVVYATFSAATGTVTISGTPTFTLYDHLGAIVTGFSAIAVTGNDSGASASRQAWYALNLAGFTPGNYVGVFIAGILGSDGITRTEIASALIAVQPVTG